MSEAEQQFEKKEQPKRVVEISWDEIDGHPEHGSAYLYVNEGVDLKEKFKEYKEWSDKTGNSSSGSPIYFRNWLIENGSAEELPPGVLKMEFFREPKWRKSRWD